MGRMLLESHKHPKYPRLTLDLRADSRFYQARTFVDGKQVSKSTKTPHLKTALKLAEDYYKKLLRSSVEFGKQHPIQKLTSDPTLSELFTSYKSSLEVKKRPEAAKRWGPIQEFWRTLTVSEVGPSTLKEFYRWRRKVGPHTLHKDVVLIRQLLKFAIQEEHIERLPAIPKISSFNTNPRPWLTLSEWQHLMKVSEKRIADAKGKVLLQRSDMHDQMVFMVATMLRVGEMLALRFRDCRLEKSPNGLILVADVKGKRGSRTIVAPREAALLIKKHQPTGNNPDLNAKVFPAHHRDAFRQLLEAADLYEDGQGFTRNMKSLRATAISFRVLQPNPNLLMIARNAGTSLAMIDTFYAKRLSAEMGKGELGKSVMPSSALEGIPMGEMI
jgi:integrase